MKHALIALTAVTVVTALYIVGLALSAFLPQLGVFP